MILFALTCPNKHVFEGWFRNNATYEQQSVSGGITCPRCGDVNIIKAPMAPHIGKTAVALSKTKGDETKAADTSVVDDDGIAPETLKTSVTDQKTKKIYQMLRQFRQEIEKNCEHVGNRFADEARKIHLGEGKKRGIYGNATAQEAQELAEEGIEYAEIPWLPKTNG